MNISSIALRVETWLSSAWHIKVPMTWLEACITWIQEENNDVSLTQAQMNKQVFDQWLLTDLRDLEYPILPDKILEVPKGELSGFYSLQINSLVDVSQPMYSQLQKLRGLNRSNDQVTAETQISLKPWEANPTRMLMLQITDGVRQIQGMEYQPIPALHQAVLPGTKILIHGKVSYRLGVLLLKPENVKVLGGEVDALVEEHAQERILARLIGEPDSLTSTRSNHSQCIPVLADGLESALEPSDEELLASLDENESIVVSNDTHLESGYFSRSISDSISNVISSSELSCITPRKEENLANPFVNFTEGDLDDFSLEDVLFLEETVQKELQETEERNSSILNRGSDKNIKRHSQKPSISEDFSLVNINEKNVQNQKILFEQITSKDKSCSYLSMRDQNPSNILSFENNAHLPQDFIVKHKSSDIYEKINPPLGRLENYMLNDKTLKAELVNEPKLISEISNESSYIHPSYLISSENNLDRISIDVNLDSPPFTYISVLLSRNLNEITNVKVKAFIVTLTGNLSGCGGFWSITAKISDGTAYLDVTFADEILTNMIGFSVSEMKQLKKDNIQHKKFQEGLQKCQRALIDLCCLMTITFNPSLSKGIVSVLQDVNMEDLQNLRRRLNK